MLKKVESHSSKTMIQAHDHLKMGLGACVELNMH